MKEHCRQALEPSIVCRNELPVNGSTNRHTHIHGDAAHHRQIVMNAQVTKRAIHMLKHSTGDKLTRSASLCHTLSRAVQTQASMGYVDMTNVQYAVTDDNAHRISETPLQNSKKMKQT
jgi:hypothetical protein